MLYPSLPSLYFGFIFCSFVPNWMESFSRSWSLHSCNGIYFQDVAYERQATPQNSSSERSKTTSYERDRLWNSDCQNVCLGMEIYRNHQTVKKVCQSKIATLVIISYYRKVKGEKELFLSFSSPLIHFFRSFPNILSNARESPAAQATDKTRNLFLLF